MGAPRPAAPRLPPLKVLLSNGHLWGGWCPGPLGTALDVTPRAMLAAELCLSFLGLFLFVWVFFFKNITSFTLELQGSFFNVRREKKSATETSNAFYTHFLIA